MSNIIKIHLIDAKLDETVGILS